MKNLDDCLPVRLTIVAQLWALVLFFRRLVVVKQNLIA